MPKAYILEKLSSIIINDVKIDNKTYQDFIIIENGCAHLELSLFETDSVDKLRQIYLAINED